MINAIERFGPIGLAAIGATFIFLFRSQLADASARNVIDFSNLYSAVFDWSAIQTGFLFGIFGYVGGKTTGFIAEIRESDEMSMFIGYMKTAIALGFIVTFASIPLLVVSFKLDGSILAMAIFCGWSFVSIWGFFAFARVAYLFGLLIRPQDKERIPG